MAHRSVLCLICRILAPALLLPAVPGFLAAQDLVPRQLAISGVQANRFRVSWVTEASAAGRVRYGTAPDQLAAAAEDVRGASYEGTTHLVQVVNLDPETVYFFEIVSGAGIFPENGIPRYVRTGPDLGVPTPGKPMLGRVKDAGGGEPAAGMLVYLAFERPGGGRSRALSQVLPEQAECWWNEYTGNFLREDLSAYFNPDRLTDTLAIAVHGAGQGSVEASWPASDVIPVDSPLAGPELTLGGRAPWLDPPPGLYFGPVSVTVSYPGPETQVTIRVTTDGSSPDGSAPVYAEPVEIAATTVLRARAWAGGLGPSATAGDGYVIETGVPGDIFQSGRTTLAGALAVLRMAYRLPVVVAGPEHRYPYPEIWHRADLNGDRRVTAADAIAALRRLLE